MRSKNQGLEIFESCSTVQRTYDSCVVQKHFIKRINVSVQLSLLYVK